MLEGCDSEVDERRDLSRVERLHGGLVVAEGERLLERG
jgi:hypothetical protein